MRMRSISDGSCASKGAATGLEAAAAAAAGWVAMMDAEAGGAGAAASGAVMLAAVGGVDGPGRSKSCWPPCNRLSSMTGKIGMLDGEGREAAAAARGGVACCGGCADADEAARVAWCASAMGVSPSSSSARSIAASFDPWDRWGGVACGAPVAAWRVRCAAVALACAAASVRRRLATLATAAAAVAGFPRFDGCFLARFPPASLSPPPTS